MADGRERSAWPHRCDESLAQKRAKRSDRDDVTVGELSAMEASESVPGWLGAVALAIIDAVMLLRRGLRRRR
jgi:hypothetical protein